MGCFSKQPKKSTNIWAIFERKIFLKNFEKSPNPVTLDIDHLSSLPTLHSAQKCFEKLTKILLAGDAFVDANQSSNRGQNCKVFLLFLTNF